MDVNRMTFNPEKYKNEVEMWKDITSFMQTLLKNEYVMVVREEDFGIIEVEYNYDERKDCYGSANPYWISQDEYINILDIRDGDEGEDSYDADNC